MVTTGVLGGRWRATITPWGGIEPWSIGELPVPPALQWHIAADDRWHSPEHEAAVRQTRLEGTAVVETRVRIPNGDAVQRVYSVPDDGGLTLIEVENESPLPIAVAFTHGRLLSTRPPTAPIEGITLPEGSVAFPVGHHGTLTVALAHDGRVAGVVPTGLPPIAGVVRGWLAMVERASRLVLPDAGLTEQIVSQRCELALGGPEHPDDDPVGFVLGVGQLVRMGEQAEPWLPDVAAALEAAYKVAPRDWALAAAFDAVDDVLVAARDTRARKDLTAMRATLDLPSALPDDAPTDTARLVSWLERRLVLPTGHGASLMAAGMPAAWAGSNFEVYGLPNGVGGTVSFAVRWHGARPAVLWEQTGAMAALDSPVLAPLWRTDQATGETLWPEPPDLTPSFS
jgi:hypothetical protein